MADHPLPGTRACCSPLTGQENPGQLPPLNAILAGLVAFVTIARLIERPRFGPISIVVVVAIVLANIVTGGVTATALALSILLGWAIGLAMRYALGADHPSQRTGCGHRLGGGRLSGDRAAHTGNSVPVAVTWPPPAPGRRWTCWCSTAISRAPGWLPASGGPYGCATTVHRRG